MDVTRPLASGRRGASTSRRAALRDEARVEITHVTVVELAVLLTKPPAHAFVS
jgi:hypothetical protein